MAAANKGPGAHASPSKEPGDLCWLLGVLIRGGWGHQEGQAGASGNKPRVRSIRFAAGHDAEGSQSHVHFDEKLHDSVVMVTQESDSSFLVKVGFLKILHRYEITFTLPSVHRLSKDVQEAPVPSLHLKLLSVMPVPEGASSAQGPGGLPSSSRAWVCVGTRAWGATFPSFRVDGQLSSWGHGASIWACSVTTWQVPCHRHHSLDRSPLAHTVGLCVPIA
ncbi:PREDICTED: UPF0687 protein C20orf27 homolog isoform X2 [Hipposideros armiger]|uniref:Adipose-secreted signaling protein n=1 Tax=Hipposideros armiger TaxID=186990 RepID=A0A8B7RGM5_HIPAR|nr:PREDICTED: UPF0687 protein C20orf27 homolog isoform X2 [Hipposideros armiger]